MAGERVAVYARVSTDEQRDSATIENQLGFARRYCELHGLTLIDTYRDEGISGTLQMARRPEGARLLSDARTGRFTTVLVFRVDRLARSLLILLSVCEVLRDCNVALRSMTEAFDAGTPSGQLLLQLLASFAEYERASILERTRLGKARKISSGKRAGGTPLLGYRTDPEGRMEVHPEEARIVSDIFRLYTDEGMTTTKLTDFLNASGVPTSAQLKGTHKGHSGKWRPSRVSEVLRNPAYKGEFHCSIATAEGRKKTVVKIPHIVTSDEWERARATRESNSLNATRNARRVYLLRSLVRCGTCGRTHAGCVLNRDFMYYRCLGNSSYAKTLGERCKSPMVRAEHLEAIVWEDIKGFVRDPAPVVAELEARIATEFQPHPLGGNQLQQLEESIGKKAGERQRIISLYRRGRIDETELDAELSDIEREVATLDEHRLAVLNKDTRRQQFQVQVMNAKLLLEQLRDKVESASQEEKHALVNALVEGITVDTVVDEKGRVRPKVTIRYRFDKPSDNMHCSPAVWRASNS